MSALSCNAYWRTVSSPRPRNASFIAPLFSSWDSLSPEGNWRWTPPKPTPWVPGPFPPTGRNYKAFWDLHTFTDDSSGISAPLFHLSPDSLPPRYHSIGQPKPIQHLGSSRIDSPQLLFSSCRIQKSNSF